MTWRGARTEAERRAADSARIGSGMRLTRGRRAVLAGVSLTAAGWVGPAQPPAVPPAQEPVAPPAPAPVVEVAPPAATAVPAPPPVVQAPLPPPVAKKLGPSGIAQPIWSPDGARVLFYDQPAPE